MSDTLTRYELLHSYTDRVRYLAPATPEAAAYLLLGLLMSQHDCDARSWDGMTWLVDQHEHTDESDIRAEWRVTTYDNGLRVVVDHGDAMCLRDSLTIDLDD